MLKKVATDLDSSKVSILDCILYCIEALKNCQPETSFILADPLNICSKIPFVVIVFKNFGFGEICG